MQVRGSAASADAGQSQGRCRSDQSQGWSGAVGSGQVRKVRSGRVRSAWGEAASTIFLPPRTYGERPQTPNFTTRSLWGEATCTYFTTGSLWGEAACTVLPRAAYGERPHIPYFTTGSLWGKAASTIFYHREPLGRGRMYRILLPGPYGEKPHVPYFTTGSLWGIAKTYGKIAILVMKMQKT